MTGNRAQREENEENSNHGQGQSEVSQEIDGKLQSKVT